MMRSWTALLFAVVASAAPAQLGPASVDCRQRETAVIAARERTATEWPKALLPQIELAVCYDKAWRFQDIEPAIAKAIELLDAEMSATPIATPAASSRPIGGIDVPDPKRTKDAQADYPTDALFAGITGTVIVELAIDVKGNVREARVVKSVPQLDEAAVKAAKKWKFEPARFNDNPTEVLSYASIRFGQTLELIPSDQLAMAAFYYERGLLKPVRVALDAALAKAREDRKRFEGYLPGLGRGRGGQGSVTPPVKTKDVRPVYPPSAQAARVTGTVIVECLLDTQGRLGRARVLSKPSVLDAAALDAVLKWEFSPATVNGAPVATAMTTTVTFALGPRR
jgi:TonB family protein